MMQKRSSKRRNAAAAIRNIPCGCFGGEARPLATLGAAQAVAIVSSAAGVKRWCDGQCASSLATCRPSCARLCQVVRAVP